MTKPEQYKAIKAWGRMMGSYDYYIENEQRKASEDDAPIDAIYERDGKWHTVRDCHPDTQVRVESLIRDMR